MALKATKAYIILNFSSIILSTFSQQILVRTYLLFQ